MPASDNPRVSVVVTCFNQAEWIVQALDSVAAQSERSIQLVVTDDGSSDGSRKVIEEWLAGAWPEGELVASDVNVGLPGMLNRASPRLTGRYVVVLNGDDWMDSERVALQADALDAAGERVGIVYSDLRVVDRDGVPTGELFPPPEIVRSEGEVLHRIISAPMIGMPSVMFRRSVLDVAGPWDESLVADDFDFLLRVAAAGCEFAYLPTALVSYRLSHASLTGSRQGLLAEGRFSALQKLVGRDPETDRLALERMAGIAVALHAMGHDRRATRRALRFMASHAPSRRTVRALIENQLHLPPAALSPTTWMRRGRSRPAG